MELISCSDGAPREQERQVCQSKDVSKHRLRRTEGAAVACQRRNWALKKSGSTYGEILSSPQHLVRTRVIGKDATGSVASTATRGRHSPAGTPSCREEVDPQRHICCHAGSCCHSECCSVAWRHLLKAPLLFLPSSRSPLHTMSYYYVRTVVGLLLCSMLYTILWQGVLLSPLPPANPFSPPLPPLLPSHGPSAQCSVAMSSTTCNPLHTRMSASVPLLLPSPASWYSHLHLSLFPAVCAAGAPQF